MAESSTLAPVKGVVIKNLPIDKEDAKTIMECSNCVWLAENCMQLDISTPDSTWTKNKPARIGTNRSGFKNDFARNIEGSSFCRHRDIISRCLPSVSYSDGSLDKVSPDIAYFRFGDKNIGPQLPFGSLFRALNQTLGGPPQEAGSDHKKHRSNGQYGRQSDKPSIGIRLVVAFSGLLVTFFLSALGHRLYFDDKRRLLGASVVCAGALCGGISLWLLLTDRVFLGWL